MIKLSAMDTALAENPTIMSGGRVTIFYASYHSVWSEQTLSFETMYFLLPAIDDLLDVVVTSRCAGLALSRVQEVSDIYDSGCNILRIKSPQNSSIMSRALVGGVEEIPIIIHKPTKFSPYIANNMIKNT